MSLAPPQGVAPSEFCEMFDAGKTRMIALPYSEKNYDDMLSRFHLIPERYGRTDRHICYINIAPLYADARLKSGSICQCYIQIKMVRFFDSQCI